MTIGIIPCAGTATRIHGIPKYLLPVPSGYLLSNLIARIGSMCSKVVIGSNPSNSSLILDYSQGAFVHTVNDYKTMSETVMSCACYSFTDNILFGMPDTYIEDDQCFPKLVSALDNGADVAVALFRARPRQHLKAGMCEIREHQVIAVVDKPLDTKLIHLWGALAWKTAFWEHIQPEDPHVGYALPRAIAAGLDVRAVRMDGGYWDCGTYAEYEDLIIHLHGRKEASEMQQIYG